MNMMACSLPSKLRREKQLPHQLAPTDGEAGGIEARRTSIRVVGGAAQGVGRSSQGGARRQSDAWRRG